MNYPSKPTKHQQNTFQGPMPQAPVRYPLVKLATGHFWSLCWQGHCWESRSHSQGSKGEYVPALQLPLHSDILMITLLTNPQRPVGWDGGGVGSELIRPSVAPALGAMTGFRGTCHVWWQHFKLTNKIQLTCRLPYCKPRAGLKRLGKSAFPHLQWCYFILTHETWVVHLAFTDQR